MTRSRPLRVLLVAYPLLPVSEDSAGGAEQVLWALERELHARGHQTFVAASDGSRISGELFPTGQPATALDQFQAREEEQSSRISDWLNSADAPQLDLVHDQSGGFWKQASRSQLPRLATLHLPRSFYPQESFHNIAENVFFNCVSEAQLKDFADLPNQLGFVRNGIALERFSVGDQAIANREYLLWLGRICEEKGTHVALDLAHEAGQRIIIAGQVYPFLYHQKYFAREIIPRLKRSGKKAQFINAPSFGEKVELLRNARALLLTSLVDETSSMVAMEAAACGTPVLGFRRGAFPEVIQDGINGKLFASPQEMRDGLGEVEAFVPQRCRQFTKENFSVQHMADRYEELYSELLEASQAARRELARNRAF